MQIIRPVSGSEVLGPLVHTAEGEDLKALWMASPWNYPFYEAVGHIVAPMRVLEIGVRLGYSLIALAKGSCGKISKITGLDIESYIPDSNRMACENIRASGYGGELEIHKRNSQEWMPSGPYDLIHVDGCHGEEEAKADILNSWVRLDHGGVLLVDDVIQHPETMKAVNRCISSLINRDGYFIWEHASGCFVAEKK
jgi:predicted O-methyltransferase YrrM